MNADPQPWLYLDEPLGELAKRRGVRLGLLLEQLAASSCLLLAAVVAVAAAGVHLALAAPRPLVLQVLLCPADGGCDNNYNKRSKLYFLTY